jgi:hypothetical protein
LGSGRRSLSSSAVHTAAARSDLRARSDDVRFEANSLSGYGVDGLLFRYVQPLNQSLMMRIVVGVLVAAALAGCAAAINASLQRDSARAIFPTPHPDSVKISEYHAPFIGGTSTWVATTPKGVYDCSIQSGEHVPICAKRGQ